MTFTQREASYRLLAGSGFAFRHRDERIVLAAKGDDRRLADPDMAPETWTNGQKTVAASGVPLAGA